MRVLPLFLALLFMLPLSFASLAAPLDPLGALPQRDRALARLVLAAADDADATPLERGLRIAEIALDDRASLVFLSDDVRHDIELQKRQVALARALAALFEGEGAPGIGTMLTAAEVAVEARRTLVGDVLPTELDAGLLQTRRNLGLTREIAILLGEGGSPFRSHVEAAKLVSTWQAESLGMTIQEAASPPFHGRPSEALLVLAERHGGLVSPKERASLAALDVQHPEVAAALTRLVDAFLALEDASRAAYAHADGDALRALLDPGRVPTDPQEARRAFASARLDLARVFSARDALLDAAVGLQESLARHPPGAAPPPACVALVFCVDLDLTGDDVYVGDLLFLVDAGGDDTYHNNAGGNNPGPVCGLAGLPAAFLLDLFGADTYAPQAATAPMGGCGKNGGGYGGVGILLDAGLDAGIDAFTAGSYATNGGAVAGLGLLLDANGDTSYAGGAGGVNGGGKAGAGMLLDADGVDGYSAGGDATNGGANAAGVGFLLDSGGANFFTAGEGGVNGGGALAGSGFLLSNGGADTYSAGGSGANGGGDTGTGFLVDADGMLLGIAASGVDDTFTAGVRGANGGAALGVGFLLNLAGGERYDLASTGPSQGANGGALVGAGFLLDGQGSDLYVGHSIGVNGGAVYGSGFLLDGGGADRYQAVSEATNGGAIAGEGFLLDLSGSDGYYATGKEIAGNGGAYQGHGLLVDGGGNDVYHAEGFALNGGAALGVGTLIDVGEDDSYCCGTATNGGADGGGVGILVDVGGNDRYAAGPNGMGNWPAQGANGGAGGLGAGFLADLGGHDDYAAASYGANGGVYDMVGIGFLLDRGGDDRYEGGAEGANGAVSGADTGSSAVGSGTLLDLGGVDVYLDGQATCNGSGTDRTVVPKCLGGAQVDSDDPVP